MPLNVCIFSMKKKINCPDFTQQWGQSNNPFGWLAENSLDIIHVLNEKGIIVYINPSVYRLLGYRQEEMVGKNAFEFVHPDDFPRVKKEFIEAVKYQAQERMQEMRIRHKKGFWKTFEVASKTTLAPDGKLNVIINSRDITERKKIEDLKQEFLLIIAHEIKTPITVIRLMVHSLKDECKTLSGQQSTIKKINTINSEVERLIKVVNSIFDTSRIGEAFMLDKKRFDIMHLAKEVLEEFRPLARQKLQLVKHKRIIIHADNQRIKQVFINLMSNAIKHSPDKSMITVRVDEEKGRVKTSVKDEGGGIPKENLPHIFEKFYQVEKKGKQGIGLGLFICKEIIEKHKGAIWVESKKGEGATFFFSLPAVKQTPSD